MAEPTHPELRLSLGSYVLGSLDPADRAALDAHLPGCPACREELASYTALPALMSRLSIDQVRQPTPTVPPTMLNRALNTVAADHTNTVTQLRRWRRATVLSAAAATIVAVVLGATLLHTQTPSPPEGTPLVAAAGVSASGSAFLQRRNLDTLPRRTRHPHRGSERHRHHPRNTANHARRHHPAHPARTPVTTSSQLRPAISISTRNEEAIGTAHRGQLHDHPVQRRIAALSHQAPRRGVS